MIETNHKRIKELRIKPERVRELIEMIEEQAFNLELMRSNLTQDVRTRRS